ncbi:MAG: class I SAM-dependent methyltransferase [Ardenticatenaceae bacterium]|nr:class I SAM-dependent methyltransferase [Anaerolineales bacterium]MCB8940720.1 class I SAM-dependent methyltransferase [Ardenticatenaceae bacterium]MCB8972059.1 class I SAM-dependent methyltransferase [Ardenticatenaceae bacterium]
MDYFARYRDLIDDWDAFVAAVERPLPTTIWANPLKITPDKLQTLMAEGGVALTPVPWYPGAFRLPDGVMPGLRWEYLAGLYQVQEEAALLPALLLDPQPGERVLDMCAAPGNKTAQMGAMMQNRGTLIANDRSNGRMRAARHALSRIGLVNVTTMTRDGANLPGEMGLFDKIMVDVPCSCEGTCRKDPVVLERSSVGTSKKIARIQTALLRKAVQLCRPGGRIVYATCTFAPEENELVLDAILRETGDTLRLCAAAVPGLTASPGLTEWQGQPLHPDLHLSSRIWPQQNDTGGFFVAVLEKIGNPLTVNGERFLRLETEPGDLSPGNWMGMLVERFGLDTAVFDELAAVRWSNRGLYLVNRELQLPDGVRLDSPGLFFIRTGHRHAKMTTEATLLLGQHATRNVIELTSPQAKTYLQRQIVTPTPAQTASLTETGFVIMNYRGYPLGQGVFHTKSGQIESHFPKAWSRADVQL